MRILHFSAWYHSHQFFVIKEREPYLCSCRLVDWFSLLGSIISGEFSAIIWWHHLSIFLVLQLVKLPRSPTVDDILMKYLEYRVKKDNKSVIYVMISCLLASLFLVTFVFCDCNTSSLLELWTYHFFLIMQRLDCIMLKRRSAILITVRENSSMRNADKS